MNASPAPVVSMALTGKGAINSIPSDEANSDPRAPCNYGAAEADLQKCRSARPGIVDRVTDRRLSVPLQSRSG